MDDREAMPVVGGPYHGRFYTCRGDRFHLLKPPKVADLLKMDGPEHIMAEHMEYDRRLVQTSYGALKLAGWAWVWRELNAQEVAPIALSLLIGGAMTPEAAAEKGGGEG